MNEPLRMLLAWLVGAALGAVFFGGLWWTVRRAIPSRRPAFWFVGSFVLRLGIAAGGFYSVVASGGLPRLLVCLLGFLMARGLVMWLTRSTVPTQSAPAEEAPHAS
ncbi:MAG: ATP synthase subunit I [Victivallales bacterium]|nr:ATP synthase subunit I [Victivallales bacterium]